MCANELSGFWEWNGPPEKPPPDGSRIDDRNRRPRAVALLRRDRDEVVPRARDEIGELHFRDGAHAHDRGAGAAADDRGLGERSVDHAPRAELLLEAERDLEGPAIDANVLADHEDALVALHLLAETIGNCLQISLFGHYLWCGVSRSSGVAKTPSVTESGEGRGDSSARFSASFRIFLTPLGDLFLFLVGQLGVLAEPVAETLDGVALRPLLEELLRDVERVVVDGVTLHAERHRLDQRRAAAAARLLDCPLGLAINGEHVGAVDDHALEPVGLRSVGQRLARVLEVSRGRVRPTGCCRR